MPTFAIGDQVRLLQALGNSPQYAEGVVTHVDAQGRLTVEVKFRPTPTNACDPFNDLLPYYSPSLFDKNVSCLKQVIDKAHWEEVAAICKELVRLADQVKGTQPGSAEQGKIIERHKELVVRFSKLNNLIPPS